MKRMSLIARAAESIGDGDIVNVQIRRYRQWQLSQTGCLASCIIPYVFQWLKMLQVFYMVFIWVLWDFFVFYYSLPLIYIFYFNQCCFVAWTEGDTWTGNTYNYGHYKIVKSWWRNAVFFVRDICIFILFRLLLFIFPILLLAMKVSLALIFPLFLIVMCYVRLI